MKNDYDELMFFEEDEDIDEIEETEKWKILIVDDEEAVHSTTKLVLSDFIFDRKKIEFYSAYNSNDAKKILNEVDDIALILLDVVMETEDSGLRLIKFIREDKDNSFVRIILRTGQPGQAPEEKIIVEYDINDYKTKTELTVQKLFTSVISALRAYSDLMKIEKNRKGLKEIVLASSKLFEIGSLKKFVSGLITQLTSMYGFTDDALFLRTSSFAATNKNEKGERYILSATGEFENFIDKRVEDCVSKELLDLIDESKLKKNNIITNKYFIGYYQSLGEIDNFVVFKDIRELDDLDKEMLDLFSTNIAFAFDNVFLNEKILDTQKEIIYKLGEVVETRSDESNDHVKRVSKYSYLMAIKYGLSEEESELLKMAAPMHDIGKIGIPENILKKPSKLSHEEFDIVKEHSLLGFDILKDSNLELMEIASKIAYGHHENWDGTGYPLAKKEEEIHLYARIISLVDVFDTMTSDTFYRNALSFSDVIEFIKLQSGYKFDPKLVQIFLENLEEFKKIRFSTN
ncbi:DUF3369 domain-containing protein [Helicovermis profundi]|uniref:Stage 0 sporulation protein A homolog n=1 Tax=Helicovermis profundi TaxID=3065157 RepID=A0AAU9E681_9FIRM|nr:DUF3369 domain-containing protein [Clostridia bacterium S502]